MKNIFKTTSALLIISAMTAGSLHTSFAAYDREIELPKAVLNWNVEYQTIDGFGVSQACDVYADQIYNFGERDTVMDLLFSKENGVGFSIMRSEIGAGQNMPTIHPDKDTWDYTPYEPEQWVMREARNRGVETFMSTVWSPPIWMKTNGKINYGGRLKKEYYGEYAKYLANYVKGYDKHHNVKIDAVSIANEPEFPAQWQSCLWSSSEFADFVGEYLKPEFEKENLDTKIIVGEEATWTDSRLSEVYGDSKTLAGVDIIGSHYYHGKPTTFDLAKFNNKRVWETEVSDTFGKSTDFKDGVYWSRQVSDFMTKSEANAFLYWLEAAYKKNNESLIRLQDDGSYIAAKRLFSIGNFSKFVRPGFVRVSVDENPIGNLHLSAFKNPSTGEFAIVAVNDGQNNESISLDFNGVSTGQLTPNITNDKYDLEEVQEIPVYNNKVNLSVSGYTTITYVGRENSETPEKKDFTIIDDLDDWSKIATRSENWKLDSNNPYNAFDHDLHRAIRTTTKREYITYELENMSSFEADIYYYKDLDGLTFEISKDNESWTEINYNQSTPILTGGFWERVTVTSDFDFEEGTKYLRVVFDKGSESWDKNLATIRIK